jgi:hypothetical protein
MRPDENLIREAQLAATGATVHDVNATVMVYREWCKYPSEEKLLDNWSLKKPGRYLTFMPKHKTWTTNAAFIAELEEHLRAFPYNKSVEGWF